MTGKATTLALVGFFFVTPMLIFSPIAGAIVDRYNRKLMMMVSDLASGLATIVVLILYCTGTFADLASLHRRGSLRHCSRPSSGRPIRLPSARCSQRSSTGAPTA